jgi:hypothetical protein
LVIANPKERWAFAELGNSNLGHSAPQRFFRLILVASTEVPAVRSLTNLPPRLLLEQLTAEYVYARLCEAAMQALASENQARMDAMSAASNNIGQTLDEVGGREHQVPQEEVTAEILELAAGITAAGLSK